MSKFEIKPDEVAKEMSKYSVLCSDLYIMTGQLKKLKNRANQNFSEYGGIISSLDSSIASVGWCGNRLEEYAVAGKQIVYQYTETEYNLTGKNDFDLGNFLWKTITGALGTGGKILGIIGNVFTGKWDKLPKDIIQVLGKVFQNKKGAKVDWANVFLGLTNEVNPWEVAYKKFFDWGKPISTGCNWLAEVINSGINNFKEFGSMANPRFWGETITETGINVLEVLGAGALVATVIASGPAWLVGAATAAVTVVADWGLNSLVKWMTDGAQTDWKEAVSDLINDGIEAVGETIGHTVDVVADAVGGVVNGVKNVVGSIISWAF